MSQSLGYEIHVVRQLIKLARATYFAMDDSMQDTSGDMLVPSDHADNLQGIMEELDALPNSRPGYDMGPVAKVEWALRKLIGEPT